MIEDANRFPPGPVERGISQFVSVDLEAAVKIREAS